MTEINSATKAYSEIKSLFIPEVEQVGLLTLNASLKLISKTILFKGTADFCLFHPRDLIKKICLDNACSFILVHNHPSGSLIPSFEDIELTKRVQLLSEILEINFVDHLIITEKKFLSLIKDKKVISSF